MSGSPKSSAKHGGKHSDKASAKGAAKAPGKTAAKTGAKTASKNASKADDKPARKTKPKSEPKSQAKSQTKSHAKSAKGAAMPVASDVKKPPAPRAAGFAPAVQPTRPRKLPGLPEFLNRELSWLEFNRRVLHQAVDPRTPLLERLNFLAIFSSNLDEFIQKRVGGLKRQVEAGLDKRGPDGMTAKQQLAAIRATVLPMLEEQGRVFTEELKPALAEQNVYLLGWDQLSKTQRRAANQHFQQNLFPVLTPLAVDPGHPFPFISNLSTSLGVMMSSAADAGVSFKTAKPPKRAAPPAPIDPIEDIDPEDFDAYHFARVKVPEVLPGWWKLPPEPAPEPADPADPSDPPHAFVKLEDIIRHNLHHLFEDVRIEEVEPFRVTRNATIEGDTEDAADLLELVEQELKQRRFAEVVRLEVDDEPFRPLNRFLIGRMKLHEGDVYEVPAELDFTKIRAVTSAVDEPELKFDPWKPTLPPALQDQDASIFSAIAAGDLLVHHPYESFAGSVERFIRDAAADPDVVALKLTLYRTADDAPFIPWLIRAAEAGKQVVCLVELKARFDEQHNVQLAQRLEKAGCHVVYGVVGYKTHCKTALVVRRERGAMRCYAHIGTGNYHSQTAKLYTDFGLLTADPRLTGELVDLFHGLTGRFVKRDFEHLLIAPLNMRTRFEQMIDREIKHAKQWVKQGGDPTPDAPAGPPRDPDRPAITAQMNSLEDRYLCERLSAASAAGVRVRLLVRGFCCLRPGVPGLSDNIHVVSVIGRFLEHPRVYRFHNRGDAELYMGSADWMYRNLNNRVECIAPIYDPDHRARITDILEDMLADPRQAWDMASDGAYTQRTPAAKAPADDHLGVHARLMRQYRQAAEATLDA
ncbi:MAG: polyphosphate kinase 1 [Planctomycetota bacterium]